MAKRFNTASGNRVHATMPGAQVEVIDLGVSIPQAVIGCMQLQAVILADEEPTFQYRKR